MTTVVVEFESSSPLAEGEEDLQKSYDFVQVIEALTVYDSDTPATLTVAENVFARCAKKSFRRSIDIGDSLIVMRMRDEYMGMPLWAASSSVVLGDMPHRGLLKKDFAERARSQAFLVESLVQAFSQLVCNLRGETDIVLIDALSCRITEIGVGLFKFEVKQLWGIQ